VQWQRHSVREGKRKPRGPFEGVPPHLVDPLTGWLGAIFADTGYGVQHGELLRHIASLNEIAVQPGSTDHGVRATVLERCVADPDLCLDVIDTVLHFSRPTGGAEIEALRTRLMVGQSVFDVAADGKSLVRRTDPTASDQFRAATTPADAAS
jgi:hypothetical protein